MTAFKMDSSEGGRGGRKEAKESEGIEEDFPQAHANRDSLRYATHSPRLLSRILWAEVSVSVQVELDCEVSVG